MYIVIFVTTKNVRQANKIAAALLADKLIACANVIKGVRSVFWWQKKIDKADETLLVLKSKRSCFTKIVKVVRSLHSYEVPEVIALPIIDGNRDYLEWIEKSCSVVNKQK